MGFCGRRSSTGGHPLGQLRGFAVNTARGWSQVLFCSLAVAGRFTWAASDQSGERKHRPLPQLQSSNLSSSFCLLHLAHIDYAKWYDPDLWDRIFRLPETWDPLIEQFNGRTGLLGKLQKQS